MNGFSQNRSNENLRRVWTNSTNLGHTRTRRNHTKLENKPKSKLGKMAPNTHIHDIKRVFPKSIRQQTKLSSRELYPLVS